MSPEQVRRICLSFPHATEILQWGDNLVFKLGGKIFAIASLEPGKIWLSFKCSPEEFGELIDLPNIIPAPYLARAQWVALESKDALPQPEVKRLLKKSYDLVKSKLTKKALAALT